MRAPDKPFKWISARTRPTAQRKPRSDRNPDCDAPSVQSFKRPVLPKCNMLGRMDGPEPPMEALPWNATASWIADLPLAKKAARRYESDIFSVASHPLNEINGPPLRHLPLRPRWLGMRSCEQA